MSSQGERPGVATDLVRGASGTVHQAADWLEQREPGTVVNELRDYARRHPGMFLAGAAVAGVLAGRLTRNLGGSSGYGGGPAPAPTPRPNIVPATEPSPAPEPAGPRNLPGDERMPESGRVPQAYTEER